MSDSNFQLMQRTNFGHNREPLLEILQKMQEASIKESRRKQLEEILKHKAKESSPNIQLSWKTSLGWLLSHEETTQVLHDRGELYQAFGVHEKVQQFDSSQQDVRFMINYCLSLMLTNREAQANEILDKLSLLVKDLGETFLGVLSMAEKMVEKNNDFEAIMLCLIAAKMEFVEEFTVIDSANKLKCMTVLREAAGKVSENTKKAKPFLRRYCVEAVRPLFEHIQQTAPRADMNKSLIRLRIAAFHCMEILLLHADDDEGRAQLLERAMEFLRETYGDDVYKRKWYGIFSNNLGATYLMLSRQDKGAEALSRAVEVFQQATDFDNEMEKQQNIAKVAQMLKQPSLGGLELDKSLGTLD